MRGKNGSAIVVLVTAMKGGSGKSTTSEILASAAAHAGRKVGGIDFDPQFTFSEWSDAREKTRKLEQSIPGVLVSRLDLDDWRRAERSVEGLDLLVIDTPTVSPKEGQAFRGLAETADFVIVPTSASDKDLRSNERYIQTLREQSIRSHVLLNRVDTRTKSYKGALSRMLKSAPVIPVAIPQFEDFLRYTDNGLTPLDVATSKGRDETMDLWNWFERETER